MRELKYFEILKELKKLKEHQAEGVTLKIRIISNIIVHQLCEILEYGLLMEGVNAQIILGDYDNIVQDAAKSSTEEIVIIFWEAANITDGFQYKIESMSESAQFEYADKLRQEMKMVFNALDKHKLVIMNRFHAYPFNSVVIHQSKYTRFIQSINEWIESNIPVNFSLAGSESVIASIGFERAFDLRNYFSSKALYTIDFFKTYVYEILPLLTSKTGKVKKVLVLDCDNTLWDGIIGEDGMDGIKMSSKDKGGLPFEAVQYQLLDLAKKGVILCLCSKNNPKDIEEVLNEHPDLVLKEEYIVDKKINWEDKETNIRALARELNLGLDSFVFIDDSDFEVNFIKDRIPEVVVYQVPKKTYQYPGLISQIARLFNAEVATKEDRNKIEQYKSQVLREELKDKTHSVEEYIKSLGIVLTIYQNDPKLIPRMAQLTQKTNQFNLTTKRYSEQEIINMLDDEAFDLFALKVEDKYGDSGITGLAIVKKDENKATIDTFLMSCRIIGRNIEYRFMDEIVRQVDLDSLLGTYAKTMKNEQVERFYDQLGFQLIDAQEGNRNYQINRKDYPFHKEYDFIKITNGKSS